MNHRSFFASFIALVLLLISITPLAAKTLENAEASTAGEAAPLQAFDLRTELQVEATGVSSTPRLSWKLKSDQRSKHQKKYHILAASSLDKLTPEAADLWNSGLTQRGLSQLIPWEGQSLKPAQVVHWKVKIYDEKETESPWSTPTTFTVGGKKLLPKPKRISTFKTSSEGLNSLYQECLKTLDSRLSKMTSAGFTELGTGIEVQRSARAILYHFDALPHLTEWIHQMDLSRSPEGIFPIHPGSQKVGALSSEAGITVQHPVWWMGGDHLLVKNRWTHFEKHMIARENADMTFKGSTWGGLKASEGVPAPFLDLCHLGFTTRLTRELALPAQQPYNVFRFQDYAGRIRKSFERQYLDDTGNLKTPSQTAHLFALRSAVLKVGQQKTVTASLLASLEKEGLKIGPIGASFLPSVLSLTGNHDKAVEILSSISQLADEQRKPFLGNGASEWLMSFLAGIDASSAGFQNIRIAPRIPSGDSLKWVEASHQSIRGNIKVRWEKLAEGALKVDFTIPAGSLARIILPCSEDQTITESGKPLKNAYGIAKATRTEVNATLVSQSGSYSVLIK